MAATAMEVDPALEQQEEQQGEQQGEEELPLVRNVTLDGDRTACLALSRSGAASEEEESTVGLQVHLVESWADGAEAASDIAAGTTAYLSNPPAARVWEGLAEHVKAKKAERMLQKLRGQERGRLEVGVWEGEGALRLVVKLPKERGVENLLDVRLSPLEGQQQGQQPSAAAVLAAALRATAAQQEKMQAALAEQRTVNRAYQEQNEKMKGLLESAITNKEKLQDELIAQFVLLLNTKKAEIRRLRIRLGEEGLADNEGEQEDEELTADERSDGERAADEGMLEELEEEEEEEEEEEGPRKAGKKRATAAGGGGGGGGGKGAGKKAAAPPQRKQPPKARVKPELPSSSPAPPKRKAPAAMASVSSSSSFLAPRAGTKEMTVEELMKIKKEEQGKGKGGKGESPKKKWRSTALGSSSDSSRISSSSSDSDSGRRLGKRGCTGGGVNKSYAPLREIQLLESSSSSDSD